MTSWLDLIAWFAGGLFLANAVPHVVSGLMGRPFQTPFAKPPGKGLSTSTVNIIWGAFNLLVGYMLLCHVGDFDIRDNVDASASGIGALAIALPLSRHFGKYNGGNLKD